MQRRVSITSESCDSCCSSGPDFVLLVIQNPCLIVFFDHGGLQKTLNSCQ